MIIENSKKREFDTELRLVKAGAVLIHPCYSYYYIKTTESENEMVCCIDLESGRANYFEPHDGVCVVGAKVVIE